MSSPADKYFDKLSSVYDQHILQPGIWNPPLHIKPELLKYCGSNSKVLYLGIGTGVCIDEIYSQQLFHQIHGVDISDNMLELCRNKYPLISVEKIDLNTEFPTGKYDVILASGSFEFIIDLAPLFKKISSALNQNGKLIFTYEPIIAGHPVQSESQSLVVPIKESSLYSPDFFTYRHHHTEINEILTSNHLKVLSQKDFVAYRKLDCDINYRLIIAEKS